MVILICFSKTTGKVSPFLLLCFDEFPAHGFRPLFQVKGRLPVSHLQELVEQSNTDT